MKKADFVFTIGYQGNAAVVDGQAKKRYGNLSTEGLIEKGLYRSAFCSALYNGNDDEMKAVVEGYNRQSGTALKSVEDMKRLLGVFSVPEDVNRTIVIK